MTYTPDSPAQRWRICLLEQLGPCKTSSDVFEVLEKLVRRPVIERAKMMELAPGSEIAFLESAQHYCASGRSDDAKWAAIWIADALFFRALRKDTDAISAIVSAAAYFAGAVKELSLTKPRAFRAVAASRADWPSMISFHPDWTKENATIIKNIDLGSKSSLKKKVRISKPQAQSQMSRIVVHIYCRRLVEIIDAARAWEGMILEEGGVTALSAVQLDAKAEPWGHWVQRSAGLPPLSAKTAPDWFTVGWLGLRLLARRQPETLPGLRDVGLFRERYKDAATGGAPGARRASIREGIRTRLCAAFMKRYGR